MFHLLSMMGIKVSLDKVVSFKANVAEVIMKSWEDSLRQDFRRSNVVFVLAHDIFDQND